MGKLKNFVEEILEKSEKEAMWIKVEDLTNRFAEVVDTGNYTADEVGSAIMSFMEKFSYFVHDLMPNETPRKTLLQFMDFIIITLKEMEEPEGGPEE